MEVGGRKRRPRVRIRRKCPLTDWDTSDTTPVYWRGRTWRPVGEGRLRDLILMPDTNLFDPIAMQAWCGVDMATAKGGRWAQLTHRK